MAEAYPAGEAAGKEYGANFGPGLKPSLQRLWGRWYAARPTGRPDPETYRDACNRFAEGFARTSGVVVPKDWIFLPTTKTVAAVITVMNEEQAVPNVIEQLYRFSLDEVMFVVNGSVDRSFHLIRSLSPASIAHYPERLGHDVGRTIGAKLTRSDIVLFLDGDFPVFAEHLIPFIEAVDRGVDLALNNINPYIGLFAGRDSVTVVKQFMNRALRRDDLIAASLTAVPHALSRKAIDTVGPALLAVPPRAQTAATLRGLVIECAASVDVFSHNRQRSNNIGSHNEVSEMIIGDHLEALGSAMAERGARLGFEDRIRNRAFAGGSL